MTGRIARPLGLYLHFPFCVRKCRYCDFLSFSSDEAMREAYLKRLKEEIIQRSPQYKDYEIVTLFIGGGTPSLMSGRQLSELMETVYNCFQIAPTAEMTIECNPGTADEEKLLAYRKAGLNRISFGLQSMNDEELKYLGRIHTVSQFLDNYHAARRAGFENINIDLMSALPGQTTATWLETLQKAADLQPEHLSAYSLIIEEGTPFWSLYGGEDEKSGVTASGKCQCNQVLPLPDEDSEREMYHLTKSILADRGYLQYETSNYAKPGYECHHNLTYWYRGDYLGLGLGASSMVDNKRFSNTSDMEIYMQQFGGEQEEILDRQAQMEETMFLGLRCIRGISLEKFRKQFGCMVMDVYGEIIDKYQKQGFLVLDEAGDRLYLTEAGMDVSNWILADFLL